MKDLAKDLLSIKKLITPKVITLVYWLMLVIVIFNGYYMSKMGYKDYHALLMIVGGMVLTRIGCELIIVLFKMNEALQDIRSSKPSGERS